MKENPYASPMSVDCSSAQFKLNANTKELLGIAKEDFLYYPSLAILIGACFLSNVTLVCILFTVSTLIVFIYLLKSFPKFIQSRELSPFVKAYGITGNLGIILIQIGVIVGKCFYLFS